MREYRSTRTDRDNLSILQTCGASIVPGNNLTRHLLMVYKSDGRNRDLPDHNTSSSNTSSKRYNPLAIALKELEV